MKIAIDLDEVLVDFITPLYKWHNDNYGTNLTRDKFYSYNFWKVWGGSREDAIKKVHEFYKTPAFLDLKSVDGAEYAVNLLAKEHKLYVVTSRPLIVYDETIDIVTKRHQNKFEDIILTNQWGHQKSKITKSQKCKHLGADLIIEDSLEYAMECVSDKTKALLYDCPWNISNDLPDGIERFYSWKTIPDKLI